LADALLSALIEITIRIYQSKMKQATKAKPFLKWAGGKNQLLSQFQSFYPRELLSGKIDTYIEPFIGGGAVFFDIMQNFNIKSAYISDVNKDLILAYKVIQQNTIELREHLTQYQYQYDTTPESDRNNLFLSIRKNFNDQRFDINYGEFSNNWIQRVAQLIFLNKTCFNGLFRVNSKGEFNVPFGKYCNPTILENDNLEAVARILQNVEIRNAEYQQCYIYITDTSFVYFDPPYRPLTKTANFTTYSGIGFNDDDQRKLAGFFNQVAREKRAKLMLSNSDPKNANPDDMFFDNLYASFNFYSVNAARAINSNGEKRGKIKELVVTNYCLAGEIV